jgi:hypothetical protein
MATVVLSTSVGCRRAEFPDFVTAKQKIEMETNPCFPRFGKGGVGIIHTGLYVATKSAKNELLFDSKEDWIGQSASTPEVVVVLDGKVWTPQSLPPGFDKSKSVVVSFEKKKICFYDYVQMNGGYYERDYEN